MRTGKQWASCQGAMAERGGAATKHGARKVAKPPRKRTALSRHKREPRIPRISRITYPWNPWNPWFSSTPQDPADQTLPKHADFQDWHCEEQAGACEAQN